jgi:arylsulfatase A-like enzyme
MSGKTRNSSNADGLPTTALRGAALGLLAAVGIACVEWALLGSWSADATPTSWEKALVPLSLAAFLLPVGAVGGAGWALISAIGDRIIPSDLARRIALGLTALVCLLGIVAVAALAPALAEQSGALTAVLGGGWMALYGMLSAATGGGRRGGWALSRAGMALAAVLAWALVFVVFRWGQAPMARAATLERAPLSGLFARGLLAAADRDGDGYAALLGGGDCDDSDASIAPGAGEVAGNHIDENCDGEDLSPKVAVDAAWPHIRRATDLADRRAATHAIEQPAVPFAQAPIVLITIDTLRPDFTGIGGAKPSPTPNLDRFAEGAVVFQRAYAQGPLTKASIGSMMTGKYFSEVRRDNNQWTVVHSDELMLAEALKGKGYTTSAITTHQYLSEPYGLAQGFDKFQNLLPAQGGFWAADTAVDAAITELETLSDKRYFLWIHLLDPHHPYVVHPSTGDVGGGPRVRYRKEISWTDKHLGRLLGAIPGDAMVVVQSDHGEGFLEHGYRFHGQSLYDDQVRVVLAIKAPGAVAGVRSRPAMLLDLFPTLVAVAAGTPLVDQTPTGDPVLGRPISLVPTLLGERLPARPVFTEMVSDARLSDRKAIVEGPFKLHRSLTFNNWQLFNVESDPTEVKNLIEEDKQTFERLKFRLERFMSDGLKSRDAEAP